jgi:hypothetical protein
LVALCWHNPVRQTQTSQLHCHASALVCGSSASPRDDYTQYTERTHTDCEVERREGHGEIRVHQFMKLT